MGTLTSCSFILLNSEFRSNPVRRAFREKIQYHELRRLRGSCYLSRKWSKKERDINFGRLRCFNSTNNVNNEKESGSNSSNDSNVTTALQEEDEDRRTNEFNSESSTSPSPSSRVHRFIYFSVFLLLVLLSF
ncbi:hypothetical protein L6164_004782 [Bauhinia variegata]|uniref:Uncharacterized protein n=1 Tax=Bauhinia variegata TaxID=167791 RepID=A0ACB9PUR0_BAUVA|nr:hypothetical protein L6164_004782 [Bauhinia variegata]